MPPFNGEVEFSNKPIVVAHPAPLDAPLRDLVGRRDKWRCCITPHDRKPLDTPEPTFIIPPALSELVDGNGTKVIYLFLPVVTFDTESSDAARIKVAAGRFHDAVQSCTVISSNSFSCVYLARI